MNALLLSGRMYNGTVHGYSSDGEERSCFRGRVNYRLPNGEYTWIDAVCFRDNPSTTQNGLVGWLEENYSAPEDGDGHGGRAIELQGWLKPTEKRKTVTVRVKGGGTKEIPNVPYESFELVIESASFVPTNHGEGKRNSSPEIDDEDFDIDDDAMDDESDDIIEEDDTPPARGASRSSGSNRSSSSRTDSRTGGSRNSGSSNRSSGSASGNRGASGNRSSGGSRSDRRSGGNSNRNSGRSGGSSGKSGGKGKDDFFVE